MLNMAPDLGLVQELKCKNLLQNEGPPEVWPQPGSSGTLCSFLPGEVCYAPPRSSSCTLPLTSSTNVLALEQWRNVHVIVRVSGASLGLGFQVHFIFRNKCRLFVLPVGHACLRHLTEMSLQDTQGTWVWVC